MEDREFNELRVKMAFVPTAERWPDQHVHWKALREAALEARSRVSKTYAQMGEIDLNPNLTPQGKATERAKVATRALAEAEASKSLENARAAVDRMMNKWAEKLGQSIKAPEDIHAVTIHSQIRERLAAMKDGRLNFIEKNIADPTIVAAVLTAPPFLSGLSDVELGVVRHKVETAISPEIVEDRSATTKALGEVEKGWVRALNEIAQRGGLSKTPSVKKMAA